MPWQITSSNPRKEFLLPRKRIVVRECAEDYLELIVAGHNRPSSSVGLCGSTATHWDVAVTPSGKYTPLRRSFSSAWRTSLASQGR
jgi:hypothetical protein